MENKNEETVDTVLIIVICTGIGALLVVVLCFTCYLYFWRPIKSWNSIGSQDAEDENNPQKLSIRSKQNYGDTSSYNECKIL